MMQTARKLSAANTATSPAAMLDPVVGLGIAISNLWKMGDDIARKNTKAEKDGDECLARKTQGEHDDNYQCIRAHETIISSMEARSIPGAMVQLAILSSTIDIIRSSELNSEELDEMLRKAGRLAASVGKVLRENSCGVDPLSEVYMGASP